MITLALSSEIAAPRRLVWDALCDPEQATHWRPGLQGPALADPDWPKPGHEMRWRCRVHDVPVTAVHAPQIVEPGERLQGRLRIGLFRLDETFTLSSTGHGRTRLGIRIHAASEVALVGGNLDRFAVRRFSTDLVATTLQSVRDWCEHGPHARKERD